LAIETTSRRFASISRCLAQAAAELLLGEQARLDVLGQIHLVFGGQQRHAADFPQVNPDQIAGRGPFAAVDLGGPDLDLVLTRHVEHVDALVGEGTHGRVESLGRKVGTIKGHRDVSHGQGASLPS
jgi:hypothetical protein